MSEALRPRRRVAVARDQHESAFAAILGDLVARVPGALAAAFVDRQGETVDYAGQIDPFDVRLAAAHWRIVLDEVNRQRSLRSTRWLALRAGRASYILQELPDDYALVVVLTRAAGFSGWRRAVSACVQALGQEAGWSSSGRSWFPVQVNADPRRRPSSLCSAPGARLRPIEVLGAVAGGLARRERAWRVRFDTGVEATLVREPGGLWYSDEPLESRDREPRSPREKRR
jgi:hypothetical protein